MPGCLRSAACFRDCCGGAGTFDDDAHPAATKTTSRSALRRKRPRLERALKRVAVEQLPVGVDSATRSTRHPAGAAEGERFDVRDTATAERPAGKVLELERRGLEAVRAGEQVGADEHVLRAAAGSGHRDDRPSDTL